MSNLQMLGAIAGGISQGRRNAEQKKRLEEDRAFLKQQREHAQTVMDRQKKEWADTEALNSGMAADMAASEERSRAGGEPVYKLPGVDNVSFKSADEARAYQGAADSAAATVGRPEAPLISPEVSGGIATTTPLPAMQGLKGTPLPAPGGQQQPQAPMAETPPPAARSYKPPVTADGQVDVQEVVRPKNTADALFYHGPWAQKWRKEFMAKNGLAKTKEADDYLRTMAERGYKQRVLEAAELQKAGDLKGAAMKLNEIYNRDYVDGAFSNVRFLNDGQVEVVRFTPDGQIVDRTVQPMPDMVNMARQILSEEKRAELLVAGTGKPKWMPIVNADKSGAVYDPNTQTVQNLPGGATHAPMYVAGMSVEQRVEDRTSRERENAADRAAAAARAAASDARTGRLTEAQRLAIAKEDAMIDQARQDAATFKAQRRKDKLPEMVPESHPMAKTLEIARKKKSTEVTPR